MKIFYHSVDFDGYCSAAIVNQEYPECELIPINYGDKFPWDSIKYDDDVWMVDFTIQPYQDMFRLNNSCKLTWIDHHKTSIDWAKEHEFYPDGDRDIKFAGCELVWKYIHPGEEIPLAVKLLGRYDVWDHSDERTLPFQYGMRFEAPLPDNTPWWDTLLRYDEEVDSILEIGKIIQEYQENGYASTCKSAGFDLEWEGLKWTAINGPYRGSGVHKSRFDREKYDAMMGFWWNGKQWTFSLTTDKEGVCVSDIATKYGGGGHQKAAGFESETLPFKLVKGL
jgi:oligoribonuclease NrnB/cAMP/cGMP phosphodiesterase (DHH superfamily)